MSYNLLMGSKYSANIVPPQPFKKFENGQNWEKWFPSYCGGSSTQV